MKWFRKKEKEIPLWKSGYFDCEKGEGGWDKLDESKLNYFIEESRLVFQAIWESKDRLAQKTSFLLVIITGLMGFFFTQTILQYESFVLKPVGVKILLALYFILLIIAFRILIKHQLPSLDNPPGTYPKNLLCREVIKFDFEEIAVKQLQLYQNSINSQIQRNDQIAKDIKLCFNLVVLYPAITVVAYALILFLGRFTWFCVCNSFVSFYWWLFAAFSFLNGF